MIKERAWLYMLIAAALAISLIITATPALKVSADPGLSEWDRVATPSADGWVLAGETEIIDYTIADDGEAAFAIVDGYNAGEDAYGYWLLKSTDHAATWEDITDALLDELADDGYTLDELWLVATDCVDPDFVAVALTVNEPVVTPVHVYISTDGGATFMDTGEVEDGGFYLDLAFDLAVSPEDDDERDIAIGGYEGGGPTGDSAIFRCSVVGEFTTGWEDARYDGWDDIPDQSTPTSTSFGVTDIEFAPSWLVDRTILVTTWTYDGVTDCDVHLQSGTWGTTEGWNAESVVAIDAVPIIEDVYPAIIGRFSAGITLPLDYSGRNSDRRYAWVWVNYHLGSPATITGEIFRVKNESVNPIGWQIEDTELWLTNVDYLGYISEGKAIAGVFGAGDYGYTGCCEGVQVYRNDNIVGMDICCYDWEESCKPPTGTYAMEAFYVTCDDPAESKAYAVALVDDWDYDESAWSVSY